MHVAALVAYLEGVRENNNKAWFVMNKPAYDILRDEFAALVAEVIRELGRSDARIAGVDAKKALFRFHRDIRFSHDKTLYKTRFSAAIAEPGHKHSGPMYYFSIDADGVLHLAAGCYLPDREVLACLRRHVVRDARGLKRVLARKDFAATFGALDQSDKLARLPKGLAADAPGVAAAAEWLKLKSYVVSTNRDVAGKRDIVKLPQSIAATLAIATPLNNWLRAALFAELGDDSRSRYGSAVPAAAAARSAPTRTKRAAKMPTS